MPLAPPPLDKKTLGRLHALVARAGDRRARVALDLSRQTLAQALAGLPVRRATADVVRMRLDALDVAGEATLDDLPADPGPYDECDLCGRSLAPGEQDAGRCGECVAAEGDEP